MEEKTRVQPKPDYLGAAFIAWWCFYFLVLFGLHIFGYGTAHFLNSLMLSLAVSIPFPYDMKWYRLINIFRHSMSLIFAILLLKNEDSLVGLFTDIIQRSSQTSLLKSFEPTLIAIGISALVFGVIFSLTKIRKYYPVILVGVLCGIWFTRFLVTPQTKIEMVSSEKIEMSSSTNNNQTLSTLLSAEDTATSSEQSTSAAEALSPDQRLALFYEKEALRTVYFPPARPDFDIIILQVCSFGWDDFTEARIDLNPFLSQFDYLFTNFNSADAYSIASGIRLMRGTCGQTDHASLFKETRPECYVMDQLRRQGYRTFTAFNHGGEYFGFTKDLMTWAKVDQPIPVSDLKSQRKFFGTTLVYNDYDMLRTWLNLHADKSNHSVLYYNTLSLHARSYASEQEKWNHDNVSTYRDASTQLFKDFNRFFGDLKTSGRRAVVIVVGEHGAALKDTPLQAQTIRQIPLPTISAVPAAIKIFGPGFNEQTSGKQIIIDRPVSYTALYTLLSRLQKDTPFAISPEALKNAGQNLPETDMVATSDTGTVMQSQAGFLYKNTDRKWELLPKYITLPIPRLNLSKPPSL